MPLDLPPTVVIGQASCPAYVYALTIYTAHQYALPAWLLLGLVYAESACNPHARNITQTESSWGLLQLNTRGGQGQGWPPFMLTIPALNLAIGTPPIAIAYHNAVDRRLSGLALIEAVCASSGHNRSDGKVTPLVRAIALRVLHVVFDSEQRWARWPPLPAAAFTR